MNNKELGEFIASVNYSHTTKDLVKKSDEIIGVGADLAFSAFLGFPVVSILKPFIEGIKDWKSRVELKQLAYYLKEFENLNQSERSEFSLMIQANEEDFAERMFYYISQLNDKRKASVCGKIGVAYGRRKINSEVFLRLISIIQRSNFEDLATLKIRIESSDFTTRFQMDHEETFTMNGFFKSIFSKKDYILISELRNLGLVIQEIDTSSLKVRNTKEITAKEISKAFDSFKVVEKFTENAKLLYFHGLINIK